MKGILIYVALVLTVFVAVDLTTRYYVYQAAQDAADEIRVVDCVASKMNQYVGASMLAHFTAECRRKTK